MQLIKNRMISVRFQGKPFNITVIQVYALTSNAEEAEVEWFYEDLQGFLELTPKKRCPFHFSRLECKSRKSRDTWSNRQVWPWRTKFSKQQNALQTGQRPTEFCQENALVIANTLFNNTRNNFTHGHHQMVNNKIKLNAFFVAKDEESLYSQHKQDLELTVAQIMSTLLQNSDLNWGKWENH